MPVLLQPNNATVPESNPHIFRIPRDWLVGQVYVAQSRPILIICKRVIIYTRCNHTKCAAVVTHIYNLSKLTVKLYTLIIGLFIRKTMYQLHVTKIWKINYFVVHEMIRILKLAENAAFKHFLGSYNFKQM